jgi:hypothetical protein
MATAIGAARGAAIRPPTNPPTNSMPCPNTAPTIEPTSPPAPPATTNSAARRNVCIDLTLHQVPLRRRVRAPIGRFLVSNPRHAVPTRSAGLVTHPSGLLNAADSLGRPSSRRRGCLRGRIPVRHQGRGSVSSQGFRADDGALRTRTQSHGSPRLRPRFPGRLVGAHFGRSGPGTIRRPIESRRSPRPRQIPARKQCRRKIASAPFVVPHCCGQSRESRTRHPSPNEIRPWIFRSQSSRLLGGGTRHRARRSPQPRGRFWRPHAAGKSRR